MKSGGSRFQDQDGFRAEPPCGGWNMCGEVFMAHMLDYLLWRGDVDFDASPFNAVDSLVLSQLSYNHLHDLVPFEFSKKTRIPLRDVAALFFDSPEYERRSDLGALINSQTIDLLKAAGSSKRFGGLLLCGYVSKLDLENEEQFSAVTFVNNGLWTFVAYRGTDDTLVGWKEDCNLGFMDTVPAQEDAACYLEAVAKHVHGPLMAGGHSKGGNLALYAAVSACEKTKKRLRAIYNHDGPGFSDSFFKSKSFLSLQERVHGFVPELSVVGMLFSHAERYITVESNQKGLMQHDPFSWQVLPHGFVEKPQTNGQSRFVYVTINGWFNELSRNQKKLFVETVFALVKKSGATTNSQLTTNWAENALKILKAITELDGQTREAVFKTVQLLVKHIYENRGELSEKKSLRKH